MPTQQERRGVAQEVFKVDLKQELDRIFNMLVDKNAKYGDAALNPNQTFSRASPIELINVRIDDKLSRIRNRKDNEDEDPELDLVGYLLLKRIALTRRRNADAQAAKEQLAANEEAALKKHRLAGAC